MTIRLRLTLWYTALLGATLILFSAIVYSALATTLGAQNQQNAAIQAQNVANALQQQLQLDILIIRNRPGAVLFPEVDLFANSVGVQVTDLDGNVLKRSENIQELQLPDAMQALPDIRAGREHVQQVVTGAGPTFLVYSVPLRVGEDMVGAVQVIQPVMATLTALNQVNRYLILGTTVSLVVAAIVGAFLAQRALAPVDTITNTASTIAQARDLGRRIEIADSASEVGRLAATFNDMLDRIQNLFQAQERLIGDVSHELRTPLTTIQGNIDLLQRMAVSPVDDANPRAQELNQLFGETLSEVKVESERMNKMIGDLLLLAQADSGGLQLQIGPVEVDTLLLDVYRQTRRLAEHYRGHDGLEVRLGSEDQALVRGDRDKLRQAILNLAENAVKYTPAGGSVTLSLDHAGNWVKVIVQDTGIGISAEQQDLIFARFYRTDKARSRELGGSGLGLSIVQSIVDAHGGKVTVESAVGDGQHLYDLAA